MDLSIHVSKRLFAHVSVLPEVPQLFCHLVCRASTVNAQRVASHVSPTQLAHLEAEKLLQSSPTNVLTFLVPMSELSYLMNSGCGSSASITSEQPQCANPGT